jgi:hypothetical protein
MRSDSVFVDESLSVDGEYRLNKSLHFCFFATGGLSVAVAAELDEEEEEEEVKPFSLGMYIASGLIANNFFPPADLRKGVAVSLKYGDARKKQVATAV